MVRPNYGSLLSNVVLEGKSSTQANLITHNKAATMLDLYTVECSYGGGEGSAFDSFLGRLVGGCKKSAPEGKG